MRFAVVVLLGLWLSFNVYPAPGYSVPREPKKGFTRPPEQMPRASQLRFWIGGSLFSDPWVQAPASTTDRDGLGPMFNARSCVDCHFKGGRGDRPKTGVLPASVLVELAPKNADTPEHPFYGGQLQTRGIHESLSAGEGRMVGEARISVAYEDINQRFSDGSTVTLRQPRYHFDVLRYGDISNDYYLSVRASPPLLGVGLLDAVPTAAKAKFGWKAEAATLNAQIAGALSQDLGIASVLKPKDSCAAQQTICQALPHGRDNAHRVEIVPKLFDFLAYHTAHMAPPVQAPATPISAAGQKLFMAGGCSRCHTPQLHTDKNYADPLLAGQIIAPYSDLQLHNMGQGLADRDIQHAPVKHVDANLWRTAPLWGIGVNKRFKANIGYLHDGRARTVEEAIVWHGGEAKSSKQYYLNLNKAERVSLLAFIDSI